MEHPRAADLPERRTDHRGGAVAGHIGVQNHGDGDEAVFRKVRIKEIAQ
jgi:hypothetical protein